MMYCYTSGTTGNPKGVAYTQRSTYLHTISRAGQRVPIAAEDNVLPVVPMFHARHGATRSAPPLVGAKITYPGPDLSPEGLVSHLSTTSGSPSLPGCRRCGSGSQQYLTDHPEADTS